MQIPIDTDAFNAGVLAVLGVDPVMDTRKDEQRVTKDGVPRWRFRVLYKAEGSDEEIVKVNYAVAGRPEVAQNERIVFESMTGNFWEMEGRAGLAIATGSISRGSASGQAKAAA